MKTDGEFHLKTIDGLQSHVEDRPNYSRFMNCELDSAYQEMFQRLIEWDTTVIMSLVLRHSTLFLLENHMSEVQAAAMEPNPAEVKETLELLDSIKGLIDGTAKVLEDGKVGISDIRYLPGIIADLKQGLEGSRAIPQEFKGISRENLELVLAKVIEVGLYAAEKLIPKQEEQPAPQA